MIAWMDVKCFLTVTRKNVSNRVSNERAPSCESPAHLLIQRISECGIFGRLWVGMLLAVEKWLGNDLRKRIVLSTEQK
jgi:hypothetical protein